MTGPASGGTERGTRAPSRLTGTQGAVGAILVVLALGLALRSIIAYLLPGSGFGVDLSAFRFWAADLAKNGLQGFYTRDFFHDYTPGYLYILWLLGIVGGALGGVGVALVKVPAILADLAIGWLVWSMLLELGARRKLALAAAVVAVVNPISWFDSVVWGQVDAVGVVFLLLGLRELWQDHPERSAILAVIAALIKPQLGILIPILALVTIRRALWPVRDAADGVPAERLAAPGATGIRARFLAWEARTDHPIRIVTTTVAALITTVALCLPFGLSVLEVSAQAPFVKSGLLSQIFATASGYPYLSVNAFNPWALIAGDTGSSLATAGLWVCDGPWGVAACGSGIASFGPIAPVFVGGVLMLAVTLVISLVAAWRPDRLTILVSLTLLALAFYVVPTRVHERYAYPVFALAILLAAISWRWRVTYALLSVTVFLNMYAVLTNPFYKNPGISDWFGIGPGLRSAEGVIVLALLNGLVFLWAFAELRACARARLADELDDEWALATAEEDGFEVDEWPVAGDVPLPVPTGEGVPAERPIAPPAVFEPDMRLPATTATTAATVATAPMPTWSLRPSLDEVGVLGWLKARIGEAPIRPDRSVSLRGERGGRLDRLDLFLVVILIFGTLLLRTFRLAEPYQMHFDEVYHARTAAEFLQYWRYGLSHEIYEWTHPHVAKYVMAAGILAWGGDHVETTSDLGVPVRADAIEPRRVDTATGQRAGERLHVATGSEIRTYDLVTRKLVSVAPAPGAGSLAIDQTNNQLVIGYDDGRIATLDLDLIGQDGVQSGTEPNVLATVDHPVVHLLATSDGADVVAASTGRVTAVDLQTGAIVGSLDLPGVADLAPASSGPAIVAAIDDVKNPAAIATSLAEILSTNAADYTALFAAAKPGSTVVLGVAGTAAKRKALDDAIAAGTLAGLRVDTVTRVAIAADGGVSFLATEHGALISTIKLAGGAHGLALVTGLDNTKLYATAGTAAAPKYDVIGVGGDVAKEGPVDQGPNLGLKPLPGPGTSVVYDAASQMVHILGLAPGATAAGPWTVYVVEPHGNAVYADARLPDGFVPTAIGGDFNPDYPSEDRQQLLVFNGAGTSAAIDAGSHDFSWRLPGVIAGALTAGLLYLLTRILFRRRLVAGLVGLFVIADGMFFVQSRIGMNDVYVGLFIIAAYTLFAAIWTGWWRGRAVFWVGMPVIGVLLGLALASKWVGAYAIGALVLLLLVRSALGRVLAILGLIGLTSVLGYMAISVPPAVAGGDPGLGNLTFLFVMIALTLVAVAIAVVHPIAWTDEELRFAVAAPAAIGALVFFAAAATGHLDASVTVGSLAVTPVLAAIALALGSLVVYVLFRAGGRLGFGPLAEPPAPDDPSRLLEPPAPSPEGWLRAGTLLGIPVVWGLACLVALPVVVYVLTYIPWAFVENHRILPNWPPGHTGQTLWQLTGEMYGYHNSLAEAHPAESPWWAWPMNLKPVWFYQQSLAGGTSAAIYDAGSLVIWWLGIPAIVFAAWMAFRRRSLALALIVLGFLGQWIPWARIDRAAFEYHYYTELPFVVMALAYFVAELWHGASRHVWALARIAAAAAIVAPAVMWLLDRPLCGFVGVESVNPGSQACPALIPTFVLTARAAGLAIVLGIGLFIVVRGFLTFAEDDAGEAGGVFASPTLRRLLAAVVALVVALVLIAALLPDTALLTLTNIPVEPIALVVMLPLGYLALQVLSARDSRRFVVGIVVAVVGWFAILYPNISALPLPAAVVSAYQGILPTYLYAFQFPITKVTRGTNTPILTSMLAILVLALIVTCLVVAYSAWVWRLSLAERAAADARPDDPDAPNSLGRIAGA